MARIKTEEEIELLRQGGKILARILRELALFSQPGVTTEDINDRALYLAEE